MSGAQQIQGGLVDLLRKDAKTALILFMTSYVAFKLVHKFFIYPYFTSPMLNMPGPRESLWSLKYLFYGDAYRTLRGGDTIAVQREWAKKYGSMVRLVGPLGKEKVMLLSPTALQKVYVTEWLDYPKVDGARKYIGLTAGFGLLTNHGEEHRLMRRFMNPAFSLPNLAAQADMYYKPIYGLIDVMSSQFRDSAQAAKDGKVLQLYEWVSRATLDIICATAFGYDSDSVHNPNDELSVAWHSVFALQSLRNLTLFTIILHFPGAESFFRSKWAYGCRHFLKKLPLMGPFEVLLTGMHRVKTFAASIVQERIQEARAVIASDSALPGKKDVMSLLVQARMREEDESGYKMSDEDMVEQVVTFLGAGHETTASGVSWTLFLLGKNEEVQAKLRAEVAPVLAEHPNPSHKILNSMPYLDGVIMESLRLFSPIPMTAREAGKSDYIDGYWVPKGTWLLTPTVTLGAYKDFWGDDAEEVKPERWQNLPKDYNSNWFQSFSVGPHHCIGKTMAIMEMKAMIAVLVSKFQFEPAYPGQTHQSSQAISLRPIDGLPLLVRPLPGTV